MRWLKKLWQFLKADLTEDAKTLERIWTKGELLPEGRAEEIKQEFKNTNFFKIAGLWLFIFLCLAVAFLMGYAVGTASAEIQCNNIIYRDYIKPSSFGFNVSIPNYNLTWFPETNI